MPEHSVIIQSVNPDVSRRVRIFLFMPHIPILPPNAGDIVKESASIQSYS